MSNAYVVRFGAGKARRYLAQASTAGDLRQGWRPFVWTKDISRAEKFSSSGSARSYALDTLGHALWDVSIAPPSGSPTGDLGGTPAAARIAA
ncbi:MAG: hypothetical protein K2Y56_11570 [Methylobacterium sp.]|uniref:hypothetical protein n=1 Tax=Methylobacterium sp. TaxID=409 RepID=UPI001DF31A14|nr:hypothetical protein [Methylobacterium sp.]MBX9719289.1 hypothetical protein [Microbacteriaceae bacterium]MBX9932159.1 hypothetical protein [Methylobacterium sp.]